MQCTLMVVEVNSMNLVFCILHVVKAFSGVPIQRWGMTVAFGAM